MGPFQSTCTLLSAANKEVQKVLDSWEGGVTSKRGNYTKYTEEERAQVAKRASEMGVAIRFFKKKFPVLKESMARTWKNNTSWN